MTPILTLTLVVLIPVASPDRADKPREPNPFAPSLPLLSDEEEDQLDRTIDRFIQYDTGQLRGDEGKKALAEFQHLGPDATLALIRGLNRAALIEGSCPAVVIAEKLTVILRSSNDPELLQFARENIGMGVTRSRHLGVIRQLRVICMLRQNAIIGSTASLRTTAPRPPRSMSVTELAQAAGSERGPRLRQVLTELEKHNGEQVIAVLGDAAGNYDTDTQKTARDLLVRNLSRQSPAVMKAKLKDPRAEVRAAAARAVGGKGLHFGDELIDLLSDDDAEVRTAAHEALVRLGRGADYGPRADAEPDIRETSVRNWREWWAGQSGR